jgi:hypothetical protein
MQWLGDLRRCGITDREFRYVHGKYPALGITPPALFAWLEGAVDFANAGGAIMQIEASGGDAVDFDALTNCEVWCCANGCLKRATIFWPRRIFIS